MKTASLRHLTVLAVTILLIACQPKLVEPTPEQAQRLSAMQQTLTPRCFGRFLIDLPKDFTIGSQEHNVVDGVLIKVRPVPRDRFELALRLRKEILEATMLPATDPPLPHLRRSIPLTAPSSGLVFDRSKTISSSNRSGRTLELLAWRDGYQIEAQIDARDTSFPEYADDALMQKSPTTFPEKLDHLLKLYERVRGRDDEGVPVLQGTCIPHGIVLGPPSNAEDVGVGYVLAGTPDVYFSFESKSTFREENELLDRGADIERGLKHAEGRTLRKGRAPGEAAVAYQEWLASGRTSARIQGHLFTAEANSRQGSAAKPMVIAELFNGYYIPEPVRGPLSDPRPKLTQATLQEAEAVGLWDMVMPTLRPRPGAF